MWKIKGGSFRRPWAIADHRESSRVSQDWAGDLARMFGQTRAHITVEQAPEDSPLRELQGKPFAESIAEVRQAIIKEQLRRQH
jgi:hypothetical protein